MLASAIASSALIAAQTIPAFAEGGDMPFDGKALVNDRAGYKEAILTPKGELLLPQNPYTVMDIPKDSHIFPDVNKLDLNTLLNYKPRGMNYRGDDGTKELLRSIDRSIKNQKQGNFYGMPLIRQMNMAETYSKRKRGLMN